MKKIAVFLALLLPFLSSCDDYEEYDEILKWSTSRVIEISSEDGLLALRDMNRDYAGYEIKLTANITLTRQWYPFSHFAGTFDGQGHTIANVKILGEKDGQALFRSNEGTIRNLHVSGEITGNAYVSGICARNMAGGTIRNCSFKGSVKGESHVGGICGATWGKVAECSNRATVVGNDGMIGGITGYYEGNTFAILSNCFNEGAVSGKYHVGGICGYTNFNGFVMNSYNTGRISGELYMIGGIVGINYSNIVNCFNQAVVNAPNAVRVGGIAGQNHGTVVACYNTKSVYGELPYLGGICGDTYSYSSIRACYYERGNAPGGIKMYDQEGAAAAFENLGAASRNEVETMNGAVDPTVTEYRYLYVQNQYPVLGN